MLSEYAAIGCFDATYAVKPVTQFRFDHMPLRRVVWDKLAITYGQKHVRCVADILPVNTLIDRMEKCVTAPPV